MLTSKGKQAKGVKRVKGQETLQAKGSWGRRQTLLWTWGQMHCVIPGWWKISLAPQIFAQKRSEVGATKLIRHLSSLLHGVGEKFGEKTIHSGQIRFLSALHYPSHVPAELSDFLEPEKQGTQDDREEDESREKVLQMWSLFFVSHSLGNLDLLWCFIPLVNQIKPNFTLGKRSWFLCPSFHPDFSSLVWETYFQSPWKLATFPAGFQQVKSTREVEFA